MDAGPRPPWLQGVVAHRGASRVRRENTLASVTEAVAMGAHAVEVDVRTTRDGVPVLHHDPTLPWYRGRARIADLTLDRLRARAPHVPTLAQALAAVRGSGVPLLLDLGTVATAQACLRAHADERAQAPAATAPWFCGPAGAMAWLRSQDAGARLLLSWDGREPAPGQLAEVAPTMVNPAHRLLDAASVARWHDRGFGVSTWTVDRSRRRAQLLDWGVDALISNDVAGALADWRLRTGPAAPGPARRRS